MCGFAFRFLIFEPEAWNRKLRPMHDASFIHDLAIVMIVSGIVTVIFHRLKQPVVLGYIVAGVIVGPHTLSLIKDEVIIKTLADVGVVFLMFTLGLHFSIRKMKEIGLTAFLATPIEVLLMMGAGLAVGTACGWGKMDSIFLGGIVAISSTTIVVKVLTEMGRTRERFAELIFGILIMEDVLAIAMLTVLSSVAMTQTMAVGSVFITLGKLAIFLTTVLVVGLIAVPPLLRYVAGFKRNEMLLVTALALCFGVCLLALELDYSTALGAFLIGAVISESREAVLIRPMIEPLRDMFSAIFFVAVGLLIQPKLLVEYALPTAILILTVVLGKTITCSMGAFVAGNDARTSMRVGMGMAQIGEFSFIIAGLGLSLKVTSEFLYPIAVTVSAGTTLIAPYLIRGSDSLIDTSARCAPSALANWMRLYTRWIGGFLENKEDDFTRQLARKLGIQVGLNLILTTAVFMVAVFFGEQAETWLKARGFTGELAVLLLGLGAILVSLPLLVATFHKLEVLGMLMAELGIPDSVSDPRASTLRLIMSKTIFGAGVLLTAIWVTAVGAALFAARSIPVALLLVLAAVSPSWWRPFVRLYLKAQDALLKPFLRAPSHHVETQEAAAPAGVEMGTVQLVAGCRFDGKRLHDFQQAVHGGAKVVAIERRDRKILAPGGHETFQAGDIVHLAGNHEQIAAARKLLGG
jgi:CPA2 family monovalent cation:H+ antiporter-2